MRALLPLFLLLCGCTKNEAQLRARLAADDQQLAALQATAQKLNEARARLLSEELELARARSAYPDEHVTPEDPPPAEVVPTFPPLPAEGMFDGAESARLRAQVEDTEKRIVELSKVTSEVQRVATRRQWVQHQLEQIRANHPSK